MYIISYCQIYSFHPSLGLDKIEIFRSFQQTPEQTYDLSHLKNEHAALFNKTTFYQLKDADSAVLAREKLTSLAELFSVELKFTIDTLKVWFGKIIKPKFFEIDYAKKQDFREKNPVNSSTVCYLCEFPLVADSEKDWSDFVARCEYLFLKNIYSYDDLKQMKIENEKNYEEILRSLIEFCPLFQNALQGGELCDEVRYFLLEDLDNCYPTFQDLGEEINHVSIPKKKFASEKTLFSEKLIAFLYSSMVNFCKTNKVKGILLSQKFIENIIAIMESTHYIHHSHVTGEIKGYVHSFCKEKARENYFKIPVVAHNLFRFDFFFLLKGLRSGVWRTRDITIGGKNHTNISFASIGNQIQFLDTIKYFHQSLSGLASSLTDKEREAIYSILFVY